MTCFRLGRHPATFGSVGFTCALCAVLSATAGLVLPRAGAAITPHSRTHHLPPELTPLHYTERSFAVPGNRQANPRSGGKSKGKPTAAHHPATSPAAAKAGKGTGEASSSRRHGRIHEPEPLNPTPMHRAGQKLNQERNQERNLEWNEEHTHNRTYDRAPLGRPQPLRAGRRVPLQVPDTVFAEVTGRSAQGDYLATLHGRGTSRRPVIVASTDDSALRSAPPAPIQRRPADPYASGISRTPDDRLSQPLGQAVAPYRQAMPGQGATSPEFAVPRPVVTAAGQASGRGFNPAQPPSQVVDGFGSELAVAPTQFPERPGNTRRRNHPLPASALPEDARAVAPATLPATLEERDAITAAAVGPAVLPEIYDRDGRLLMPAPLRGSREVLVHQNAMADNDGLERIQNDAELNHLRVAGYLVGLPGSDGLRINPELPYNRRAARPWTALFAQDVARDYFARFHQPLWLTSAVRTVAFQARLQRVNGNAAGLDGDFASPHLTGQAIDFGKHGMGTAQLAWMRAYLLPLMQAGKIDVEEEFQQSCFHISVYRSYAAGRRPANELAQVGAAAMHTTPTPTITPDPNPANQ